MIILGKLVTPKATKSPKNTKYQHRRHHSLFSLSRSFFGSSFFLSFASSPFILPPSGPTANSPTLATLSGDLPTPFNLTTSGHQFLVRWSSDHGTNKKGFKIRYVGEYQSMYPNFILLLLHIIIMHGNKDRSRQRQTEGHRDSLNRREFWEVFNL